MVKGGSGSWLLAVIGLVLLSGTALAQPENYRVGPGDILLLTVPQQPELGGTLTIGPDGTISILRVGSIGITGLTPAEAEELILQRLQLFNPDISDITVSVSEYNALRIFVLGAVANPGPQTFVSRPSLWDAIRAAGGPTDVANLSLVRVVRQVGGPARTTTYDLSAIVAGQGELPDPQLNSGDSVVIPVSEGTAQVPAEVGVQVFGSVATPTTVPIQEPMRLLTVLMLAGSPLVESDLEKVWWVHREADDQYRSTKVNVKLFMQQGRLAGNPLVYPGDSIQVEAAEESWIREHLGLLFSAATATAAVLLAIDRLESP